MLGTQNTGTDYARITFSTRFSTNSDPTSSLTIHSSNNLTINAQHTTCSGTTFDLSQLSVVNLPETVYINNSSATGLVKYTNGTLSIDTKNIFN